MKRSKELIIIRYVLNNDIFIIIHHCKKLGHGHQTLRHETCSQSDWALWNWRSGVDLGLRSLDQNISNPRQGDYFRSSPHYAEFTPVIHGVKVPGNCLWNLPLKIHPNPLKVTVSLAQLSSVQTGGPNYTPPPLESRVRWSLLNWVHTLYSLWKKALHVLE